MRQVIQPKRHQNEFESAARVGEVGGEAGRQRVQVRLIEPLNLRFMSEDDMWVFIDKELVVDMGGIHTPMQGDLTIKDGDAVVAVSNTTPTSAIVTKTSSVSLGLTSGDSYEIAVF